MDPDQPAYPRSLIRIHTVCLPTLLQIEKLIVNSMDPDLTALMRRLVWIHAGRKRTVGFVMTQLIYVYKYFIVFDKLIDRFYSYWVFFKRVESFD
jgi:hypothetical protein